MKSHDFSRFMRSIRRRMPCSSASVLYFLRIIIPRLPDHLKTFDVEKLFEEKFRFSLKLYTEFIFAFAVHAVDERHRRHRRQVIDAPYGFRGLSTRR